MTTVRISPGGREVVIDGAATVRDLLKRLGIAREEVLVIDSERRRLLSEEDPISEDLRIEVRMVISGG